MQINDLVLVSNLYDRNPETYAGYDYSTAAPYFKVVELHDGYAVVETIDPIHAPNRSAGGSAFSRNAKQYVKRLVPIQYLTPVEMPVEFMATENMNLIMEIKRFEFGASARPNGFCNVRAYMHHDIVTVVISECLDHNGKGINKCRWSINDVDVIANMVSILIHRLFHKRVGNFVHYVPPRPFSQARGDDFAMVSFRGLHMLRGGVWQYSQVDFHNAPRGWVEAQIGGLFPVIESPAFTEQLCEVQENE